MAGSSFVLINLRCKIFHFSLQFRGNAGSHDLSLSVETLAELSKVTKEGECTFLVCAIFQLDIGSIRLIDIQLHPGVKMKLPRYDKVSKSNHKHLNLSGFCILFTNSKTLSPVCVQWER